jgi:glycosyltransferase involved in cell wall biosynthesis
MRPCWIRRTPVLAQGLDIHGFFLSEVGLGHSARLYYAAAKAQYIAVNAVNVELPGRQSERTFETIASSKSMFQSGLSIDGLVGFGRLSREICRLRQNIALPLWELEKVPIRRVRNLRRFDALWAPSTFIKDNLEAATGRRVELVRHPLIIPQETKLEAGFHGPLKILFFFDFDSFPARKNPEGAVRAFQLAFPGKEDVLLTIKTRGKMDSGRRVWLSNQAARDSRITIIDATLSTASLVEMMRQHDVFLSLHRSEGFGLGCAEALAIGNIVVATDYGGTRDFVKETSGYPVEWVRTRVQAGDYVEADGATWADPSIEHAAQRLRDIYDSPLKARERARFGRVSLRREHSLDVIGHRIKNLLGF